MSDRETVTFDPTQFTPFMQRFAAVHAELQIIRERLGPTDKDKSIQQTLEALVAAIGTGSNSDIGNKLDQLFVKLGTIEQQQQLLLELIEGDSGPITTLQRKVDEFMATQEERLRGVKTKLDAIQTGVDKIQAQLADLKANNPELEDEISAIEATAAAIDTDVNPADTSGGGTGGATGGGGTTEPTT